MCSLGNVSLNASVTDYTSIHWTSSGTGSFNNPNILNPEYIPSLADWNNGSVIRSWLVELMEMSFRNDPKLEMITGASDSSGEAQWTVEQALQLKVFAEIELTCQFGICNFVRASADLDLPVLQYISIVANT